MLRMLFFFMGVPMMIMSFFHAYDALPFASDYNVLIDGKTIELTVDEKEQLRTQVELLLEKSHTMPAFGVVTQDIYQESIKDGFYVSIKFDNIVTINELPFDELVFGVNKGHSGFNLLRGIDGVFEGRCIYISLEDGNMDELYNFVTNLSQAKETAISQPSQAESQPEEQIEEKISD